MVDKYSKHPSRAVVENAKEKCQESLKNSSFVLKAFVAYQPQPELRKELDEDVQTLTNNVEVLEKRLATLEWLDALVAGDPELEATKPPSNEVAVPRRLAQTDAQNVTMTLCG